MNTRAQQLADDFAIEKEISFKDGTDSGLESLVALLVQYGDEREAEVLAPIVALFTPEIDTVPGPGRCGPRLKLADKYAEILGVKVDVRAALLAAIETAPAFNEDDIVDAILASYPGLTLGPERKG